MAEFSDLQITNEDLMIKNEKVRQYLLNNYGVVMTQYGTIDSKVNWFIKLDEEGKTIEPLEYYIDEWKYPDIPKPDLDELPLDKKQMREYFNELERKKRRFLNKDKLLQRLMKRLNIKEEDLLDEDDEKNL